jgi:hypothetical protein
MEQQVESSTHIQEQIDAARARAQAKGLAQQEKAAADEAARNADTRNEMIKKLAAVLPSWMLEYVQGETSIDHDAYMEFIIVALPGCSPLQIGWNMLSKTVAYYEVWQPLRLEWDETWWVRRLLTHCGNDLDMAIDLASRYGESWHEMLREAARRNDAGESPEPPAPAVADPIDQARHLIRLLSAGEDIRQYNAENSEAGFADDRTLVLAAVGIAIAHHVSRIADALEGRDARIPF